MHCYTSENYLGVRTLLLEFQPYSLKMPHTLFLIYYYFWCYFRECVVENVRHKLSSSPYQQQQFVGWMWATHLSSYIIWNKRSYFMLTQTIGLYLVSFVCSGASGKSVSHHSMWSFELEIKRGTFCMQIRYSNTEPQPLPRFNGRKLGLTQFESSRRNWR